MSIALLGLVSFQLYWINSAIKLGNERFEKDVNESLRNVAAKLERNEMLFLASKQNVFQREMHDSEHRDTDWLVNQRNILKRKMKVTPDSSTKFEFRTNQNNVAVYYTIESSGSSESKSDSSNSNVKLQTEVFVHSEGGDHEEDIIVIDGERVDYKANQFEKIVVDMLSMEVDDPTTRIHPSILDSLLHEEFENKGIDISFQFGVFDPDEEFFILSNTNDAKELQNSTLRANLFPNDLLGHVNYLIVNFPNQNNYLLTQISATLLTSLILIAIIIVCLWYAIRTILRQKKLSDIKNDFINNMTHEFKTPITTVSLATQALNEPGILDDRSKTSRYLGVIRDETNRLGSQVEKVLKAATLDKNSFELSRETADIAELITNLVDSFQVQVEDSGGVIRLNLPSNSILMDVDVTHFSNSIRNLLENALKYSKDVPQIVISISEEGRQVKLTVEDNGIGIGKSQQTKIFEKFYRVPTGDVHDVKGFGLGLSYVKAVIESHGGSISLSSEPGQGSKFIISIPNET